MSPQFPAGDSAGASSPLSPGAAHWPSQPESFWAVVFRRLRYLAVVAISVALFTTLGWMVSAPPANWAGVSLLAWQNHGLLSPAVLAILLVVATAIGALLVHPDSPHTGLFCALLGLAGLSIRGGTIHMLVVHAQETGSMPGTLEAMALECVQWGIVLVIGEVVGRQLHDRFFKNTHWITRTAPMLEIPPHEAVPGMAIGVSAHVSGRIGTSGLSKWVGIPLAMIASGVLATAFLYALMQSQAQGQVLMACFVAFFGSTSLAYLLVPRVPMLPLLLTVPLVAMVGYLIAAKIASVPGTGAPPGHVAFFAGRALPIVYIGAGAPGAITGYYTAFRWSLHSVEEPEAGGNAGREKTA